MRLKKGNFTQNDDLLAQRNELEPRGPQVEQMDQSFPQSHQQFGLFNINEDSFYQDQKEEMYSHNQPPRQRESLGSSQMGYNKQKRQKKQKKSSYQESGSYYNNHEERKQIDELDISSRSRALLLQQRAILEDNMKDLAYMELISGGNGYGQNEEEDEEPSYERATPKEWAPNARTHQQPSSYRDKLVQEENQYTGFRGEARMKEEYELGPGLTPGASRHYEGVKNLYQQEIDILKYNIWQCQQQDRRLPPEYDQKEEKLWQSFSQSPSPYRNRQQDFEELKEEPEEDEEDYEIRKVKIQKPKNILKNEVYLKMTESEREGSQPRVPNSKQSHTDRDFGRNSNNRQMQNSLGFQSPISPRASRNGQEYSEDELEVLRKENESLKQSLRRQQEARGGNQLQTMSVQSKGPQKTVASKDPSYQHNNTNPYQNNLYNSAMKEPSPSTYYEQRQVHQSKAFSPMTNQFDQRDQAYEELLNADEGEFVEMKRREQAEKEESGLSPYAKLGYYERMMQIRKDREREEEGHQNVEKERVKYQRNVLRKKNQEDGSRSILGGNSSKYHTPIKGKGSRMSAAGSTFKGAGLSRRKCSDFSAVLMGSKMEIQMNDNYYRKVSKYDLDRQAVDFERLRREKERERTDGNKAAKAELDKGKEGKKVHEQEQKDLKIAELQAIKEKQERERKMIIKKNQEDFRRAIEERRAMEGNQVYLSPNAARKGNTLGKSPDRNEDGWVGTQKVEGTPRAKDSNKLPQQQTAPRLSNTHLR